MMSVGCSEQDCCAVCAETGNDHKADCGSVGPCDDLGSGP